jgi:hypothetical protein
MKDTDYNWTPMSEFKMQPDPDCMILLHDGSIMYVIPQIDGDFWSEELKIFIDPSHVSHFRFEKS